jgi:hypothetical protein
MPLKNITGNNLMKYLTISLALIFTLLSNQAALAEIRETASSPTPGIERIVVIAEPEVANFEIFSLKHSEQAMNEMMTIVLASLGNDETLNVESTGKSVASI